MTENLRRRSLGQYYTQHPTIIGDVLMLANKGHFSSMLEPSCGRGDLVRAIMGARDNVSIDAWEIDEGTMFYPDVENIVTIGDFFSLAQKTNKKYDLIVMNPPYVAWKNVQQETKESAAKVKERYSDKTNLSYIFMDVCIDLLKDGGRIIGIIPANWMYATSAQTLRHKMANIGHLKEIIFYDGKEKYFQGANLTSLMVFEWSKGDDEHKRPTVITERDGRKETVYECGIDTSAPTWVTAPQCEHGLRVSDVFDVRVGVISGADSVYCLDEDDVSRLSGEGLVVPYVGTKGEVMWLDPTGVRWEQMGEETQRHLLERKSQLLGRKIRKFDES